ncbi:hypothetical protein EAF64_05905 [Halorientalis pallida]|uniref:DUF8112 domain-containing protein n=1 Tax=Halorientalis pallida TaxID=2479928 RepID=A0A498L4D8_9EURY|nr:hypothetical protein EAF64_05905 [Halorientalis pallida]
MTRPSPAAALNGVQCGHICDRCNRGIRTGDKAVAYGTYYERGGWTLRRVWCDECADKGISNETEGADEVLVEAVYWQGKLASVTTIARSRPSN